MMVWRNGTLFPRARMITLVYGADRFGVLARLR